MSLLDQAISDLPEMPEYKIFPAGAHKVTVTFETKKLNESDCLAVKLTAVETLELNDPEADVALTPGDISEIIFDLNPKGEFAEFAKAKFRAFFDALGNIHKDELGAKHTASEIIQIANNGQYVIVTDVQVAKKIKDGETEPRKYQKIVDILAV